MGGGKRDYNAKERYRKVKKKPIEVKDEKVRVGVVTKRQPTPEELADLRNAWFAAYVLRSNSCAIFKDGVLIGPGTGQQDRVRAVRHAVNRVRELEHEAERLGLAETRRSFHDYTLNGAVIASEALFPFRDSIDAIGKTGITAVAQTGGSLRDRELSMILTGERTFRH